MKVFTWNGTGWVQKGGDITGEAPMDLSGFWVSMPDANTVGIGAHLNDDAGEDAGQVRIFTWNAVSSAWEQKGADIDGVAADDRAGECLSMPDANTVAVGAYRNDDNGSNAGHVRIFAWNAGSAAWEQKGTDIYGKAAGDQAGISVSMPDANTVAVGATYNDGGDNLGGQVRIFEWNDLRGDWVQKGADINGTQEYGQIGHAVSMPDANTLAMGTPYYDNGSLTSAGLVQIFTWNGTAWVQKGADIMGTVNNYALGKTISMPDPDHFAVGATNLFNEYKGQTRVYEWGGTAWEHKGISIDGEAYTDYEGMSVSMPDAYTFATGAPYNDGGANDAGQARIFQFDIPTPLQLLNFNARRQEDHTALLKWSTADERDFSHFELEHSTDGQTFDKIGEVKAKSMERRDQSNNYEYVDKAFKAAGKYSYYRLKMVDLDGSFVYSEIKMLDWGKPGNNEVNIFPNPFNGAFNISSTENILSVRVNDNMGKEIYQEQFIASSHQQAIFLKNVAQGIYFLTVQTESGVQMIKLIKE